jgi:simple sugar transport system ATP-binding protein
VEDLSGGNQQKVILARELSEDPDIIIASQPTRGLDIGAAEFVHRELLKKRDEGKAILLISADLEEVLALSDRVGVIYNGRIVAEFKPEEVTLEDVGIYMLGGSERRVSGE